jgi:hypothetical protein
VSPRPGTATGEYDMNLDIDLQADLNAEDDDGLG